MLDGAGKHNSLPHEKHGLSTCLLMFVSSPCKAQVCSKSCKEKAMGGGIFVTSCKPNLKGATSKKTISPNREVSEPSQLGTKRQSRYPWPWCRVQCSCHHVIVSPPLYDAVSLYIHHQAAPSFRLVVLISREWWPVEIELLLVMEVNILDSGS